MRKIFIILILFFSIVGYGQLVPSIVDKFETYGQNGTIKTAGQWAAQTFTNTALDTIYSVQFYLQVDNAIASGYAIAQIYAQTGTYHSSTDKPTGSALATSDSIAINTFSVGSLSWVEFKFTGSNKITLSASTYYAVVLRNRTGNSTHFLSWGYNTALTGTGSRNSTTNSGATWSASSTSALLFRVYRTDTPAATTNIKAVNTVTQATYSKINTVTKATIKKVNGITN